MGRAASPPCCLAWSQTMVGEMKVMVTSFKMPSARTVVFSAPEPQQATINPRLCWKFLDTHRQLWLSLLWEHCFFLLAPGGHKILFVSSKSLFLQSCGSSVIKSHGLQSQIPWGCSVPLPDPQIGKSVVGSRNFLTVQEFLWYNCSAVCVSSSQRLYGVANGNFPQEGLCHMLHDPGLLQPESLSLWQATADQCLHKRHSKAGLTQALWGLWVLVCTRFCLSPPSISARLGFDFDFKCDYALLHLVGASPLPFDMGYPFIGGSWQMGHGGWTVLTKRGPLEKGMANHFIFLPIQK